MRIAGNLRISSVRIFLIVLLLFVFFNEYLVYVLKTFVSWPPIFCNEPCNRILIVADPQLLGERNEHVFTRFDSDRFIRNTFSVTYDYVKPNGVLFLGDLLDEGSVANDDQYERYYHRFRHIFQLEKLYSSNIPVVFIAGDNDIGGEGNDVIKSEAVERFSKYFGKENTAVIRNIRIFKVNKLLHTYSKAEDASMDINISLNLAISHLPLTNELSSFASQIVRDLKPDFILSAHEHKSYAHLTLQENGEQLYYQQLKRNYFKNGISTWKFKAGRTTNFTIITELTVPTCSYRMGESDVGYGVLIQSDTQGTEITYHVLWLPSRFVGLYLYISLIVLTLLIVCFGRYGKCPYKSRTRYSHF